MRSNKIKKNYFIIFLSGLLLGAVLSSLLYIYYQQRADIFLPTKQEIAKNSVYQVKKVIDGDTIQVWNNQQPVLVRLLGINTPEVENKYRHQQCFGPEASAKTKKLLTGQSVYLLPDPLSPPRDKYGRWLRYVFLLDGTFINADLVQQGYAWRYIYQPIEFGNYFADLEKAAQKERLGLWGPTCNYAKVLRE